MLSSWKRSFANLSGSLSQWESSDPKTRAHVEKHMSDIPKFESDPSSGLIPKQMFWPPRVVRAAQNGSLLVFFGSGVSLAAGLPNWIGLLRKGGLDDDLEKDPHVSDDMLTLAELAAHTSGASTLQDGVRSALNTSNKAPTTAHNLLAALGQRFYITTNYDTLFEKAWHRVHKIEEEGQRVSPIVITTDDDVRREFGVNSESELEGSLEAINENLRKTKNCVLFKVHGSVGRQLEYLVLTRSDYRRHYRTNRLLFLMVKKLMSRGHTLFLGFGHRDPEIIRLIDDVVHEYENLRSAHSNASGQLPQWPGIYSLQFDMLQRTPEVFAARGIVALQPPLILSAPDLQEAKGFQLAQGLTDLLHNADLDIHNRLSLDNSLSSISDHIDAEFLAVLKKMDDDFRERALRALAADDVGEADSLAAEVLASGLRFCNQGVYLVQRDGTIAGLAVPSGLDKDWRVQKSGKDFGSRPFFRQATSLREPFVSDSFPSQFNGNSTIALCLPLLERKQFAGLLFLAHQLRESDLFYSTIFNMGVESNGTLLLVDSTGLLLFPPEGEFGDREPTLKTSVPEDPKANVGFDHERLLYLSRRDKRVERIARNVVPLAQDDDVYPVALDTTVYTVLTELRSARWKIALTRFFPSKFQVNP